MGDIEAIIERAKNNDIPIIQEEGLQLLVDKMKEYRVQHILEIGTAIGFSSMVMASQDKNIRIDTLEVKEDRYKEALKNISRAGLDKQIHVHLVDAIKFETDHIYDMIFIDGPKAQYGRHLRHFIKNLSKDGFFIIDNLEFHGMVDDPSLTDNHNTKDLIRKIKKFRDEMLESKEFQVEYYKDVGDGIMLVRPK